MRTLAEQNKVLMRQFAEGDLVFNYTTSTGTHTGELMGITATGQEVSVRGMHVEKIINGQIVERWEVINVMGLMKQIGAMPAPTG